jgi:hypothetical protein
MAEADPGSNESLTYLNDYFDFNSLENRTNDKVFRSELPMLKLLASCSTVTWFTRTFPASATELLISAGVHFTGSMP